ncbi:MAG: AI-2E family transporter [Cyanobacteriota bacterium]|jgi:predicted PurR-regulated permease PerM
MLHNLLKDSPPWLKFLVVFPLLFLNGALLFLLMGWIKPLVNYLVIATLVAFLLELTVKTLESKGVSKQFVIGIVASVGLILILFTGLTLLPLMVSQLGTLVTELPEWLKSSRTSLESFSQSPLALRLEAAGINPEELVNKLVEAANSSLDLVGANLLGLLKGTLNGVLNTFIITILTIFLLIGGDQFWRGIFSWFPRPWNQKIPNYATQIFKDFFISRLILAAISSVARLIVFLLLGIPYGVLFAFGIGIASLVPFAAGIITLATTLALCLKSVKLGVWFFLSATIIDQVVDSGLGPKLMSDKIGLNPIWIIISIFVGAELAGILGVILAVPVASLLKRIADDIRHSPREKALPVESTGSL